MTRLDSLADWLSGGKITAAVYRAESNARQIAVLMQQRDEARAALVDKERQA